MDTLFSDLRYALRTFRRNPGFTAIAVLTLALGIGANTTMFSVINATLLQPLTFPESERLMTVWKRYGQDADNLGITSLPNFRDWRDRNQVFDTIALFDSAGRGYGLSGGGEPEQVSGIRVTASFFDVLGVRPLLGRTFTPEEEEIGRDRVVVLGHGLWQRRFGGDPAIVGRTIPIDGQAFTVVGVMPAHFRFQFWSAGPRELFVPAGWTIGDQSRGANSFVCIARLKAGVDVDRARAEMDTIGRALAQAYPESNEDTTVRLVPMTEFGLRELRPALYAMLGVVGFVLLIACVNVANLLLARAAARQRELAIRCALGAGRGRVIRQLLTESVLLGLLGGAGGLVVALLCTTVLVPILPGDLRSMPMRPLDGLRIDGWVLAFTTAVALLSGVLFGLAPALAAFRGNLVNPMKEQQRGSTGAKNRLRYGLVALETALTLVVLAGAGVMIASVSRLLGVSPGLDPTNVLVMEMSLPQEDLYNGPPGHPRFCDELQRQVGSVSGVLSVSAIGHLPLSGGGAGRGLSIEGQPDPGPGREPGAGYSVACPGWLKTLGIPLVGGRDFVLEDRVGAPDVAIVNRSFAKRFWPDDDAVGKRFKIGPIDADNPWMTVAGVYEDVRQWGLANDSRPAFLRPYSQAAWPFVSVITKTAAAPGGFIAPVKKALAAAEPTQPVSNVRTMEEVIGMSVSSRRFPMMLLSGFALLALILAAVGIAGVVGYSVVQRTQEIGVRMALGAQSGDVLRLIVGQSLSWALAGLVAGLAASFALLPFLRTLVFGVTPTDPLVLGVVSAVLVTVAVVASLLPARRATRVDPVGALRGE